MSKNSENDLKIQEIPIIPMISIRIEVEEEPLRPELKEKLEKGNNIINYKDAKEELFRILRWVEEYIKKGKEIPDENLNVVMTECKASYAECCRKE